MKIVEVIPQLASGGAERFAVDLCNGLVLAGHDVVLIVLYDLNNPAFNFYLNEVSPQVKVVSMKKKIGADLNIVTKLSQEIRKHQPDIVHSHLRALTYLSYTIMTYRHPRYFHTIHSAAPIEIGGKIGKYIRRYVFNHRRVVPVTISRESNSGFSKFYGISAPIVFNGRDIAVQNENNTAFESEFSGYRKNSETRVLVNLARFMDVKRQDMIARICKRLEDEGYNFTMLMIGRAEFGEMLDAVKKVDAKSVKILGEKNNPLDYLHQADGFCLFSAYEGMPISLIEAMGCGAVPVCTPVGGIVDVVKDGYNGFVSTSINEDDCYMTLKRFLKLDNTALNEMKKNALTSYEPYNMTACTQNYINLFSSADDNQQYTKG